ncbi:MAG: glycosyltransferase family 2 protein [Propionibacteriaceae bacterium]|nr:glycosyltransferase family 2 protein [Propionibacteriaceae bacterium]
MDHCIGSLLTGSRDIEIIIVNDGSTKDNTAEKADKWHDDYPDIIKVIHQENKGHGGAVMAGLREATGVYLHVVDSDDWLDRAALNLTLSKLRRFINSGSPVDLMITNYVYEHTTTGTRKVIHYRGALHRNRIFTWNELGSFKLGQNLLMHSLTYRTQVLRDSGLELPEHTFYVDNIFAYVPLPFVETLYYLPVDLYRYFIGRDDQSVNEQTQIRRLDELVRVTLFMVKAFQLPEQVANRKLAKYMIRHLGLVVAAPCMYAVLADTPEAFAQRDEMWREIDSIDPKLRGKLYRYQPAIFGTNVPGRFLRRLSITGYRLARRYYRFN